MTLHISRDTHGNVVITDKLTGKSEALTTTTQGRPSQTTLRANEEFPSFMWDRLAT